MWTRVPTVSMTETQKQSMRVSSLLYHVGVSPSQPDPLPWLFKIQLLTCSLGLSRPPWDPIGSSEDPFWGPQTLPAFLPTSSTLHPPHRIGQPPLASPLGLGTILTPALRSQLLISLTPPTESVVLYWGNSAFQETSGMPGDILGCHTWPLGHWHEVGGVRDALKPCMIHRTDLPLPHKEGVPRGWQGDPQDVRRAEAQKACCPGWVP